jgi:ribosomal protein L32
VATRPEYWWFTLFNSLGSLLLGLTALTFLRDLWFLALIVPALSVLFRRHHDAGRSGWWLLASIIPPWEIVLLCYPSRLTGNKYAADRNAPARTPSVTEASATSTSSMCPSCGKLRLPGQNYCMSCGTKFADD